MIMKKQLRSVEVRKLGEHRGKPRLWIDGSQAEKGGFLPGVTYTTKRWGSRQFVSSPCIDLTSVRCAPGACHLGHKNAHRPPEWRCGGRVLQINDCSTGQSDFC